MDEEVDPAAKTTLICDWGIDTLPWGPMSVTPICEVALVAARKMSCCKPP